MPEDPNQTISPITQDADVPQNPESPSKKKALANASFVFGIIGFFIPLVCIPAIICGHWALNKIKKDPKSYDGESSANVGLLLGYLFLTISVVSEIIRFMINDNLKNSGY